ncbi:MAG: PAS domain S-box protein [Candidatus Bathyarchaeota archaeon]|nr:PAS domain S-box protein [Candidatus Bathyarchaeota archaeon]
MINVKNDVLCDGDEIETGEVHVLALVFDKSAVLPLLKELEKKGGITVDVVYSVNDARGFLARSKVDALLVHWVFPKKDDVAICEQLSEQALGVPLIVLVPNKKLPEAHAQALHFGLDVAEYFEVTEKTKASAQLVCTILNLVKKKRAFEDLKAKEEKFQAIIEAAKDGIVLIDSKGKITFWNKAAQTIFGYTKKEAMGKTLDFLMPSTHIEVFRQSQQKMFEGLNAKGAKAFPSRVAQLPGKRKDGAVIPTEMSMSALTISDKWQGLAIIRDATESQKAENEISRQKERSRAILDSSPDAIIFIDLSGKIIDCNNAAVNLFLYPKTELIGKNALDLSPETGRDEATKFVERVSQIGIVRNEETLAVNKKGETFSLEYSGGLFKDKFNRPAGLVLIGRDITERKNAELEMAKAKERFRVYVENSPVAVFVANPEGKYEYANEAASKLLGYSCDELLTMSIPQLLFEEDLQTALKSFAEVKKTGRSLSEVALKTKTGRHVYVILNSVQLPDGNLLAFCENVTQRKKAEQELLFQTERVRATFAASPDAILNIDLAGRIVDCNDAVLELFCYESKEQIIGRLCLDLVAESERERTLTDLKAVIETNKIIRNKEFKGLKGNGEEFTIEVSSSTFKGSTGKIAGVIATARDITDRKKAETQIRLLSSVAQQTIEGIAVSDNNGKILFVNSAWLKMHGYTEEDTSDLIGHWIAAFYYNPQLESLALNTSPENVFRGRITQVRKDGTTFPALATLSPLKNENGDAIGVIHMAKNLTEIVRDIRDVGVTKPDRSSVAIT